jgi:hypothetical protein
MPMLSLQEVQLLRTQVMLCAAHATPFQHNPSSAHILLGGLYQAAPILEHMRIHSLPRPCYMAAVHGSPLDLFSCNTAHTAVMPKEGCLATICSPPLVYLHPPLWLP